MLGGSLKRREKLSGRLADILSQLYLASAAIKRFSEQGHPRDDLPLLRWSCDTALHSMQEQMDGLLRNLPSRPVAWLLRLLVFPLGRHFAPPDDTLGHQLAELLLAPSDVRDRLTDGMFIPAHEDGALGILEDALVEVLREERRLDVVEGFQERRDRVILLDFRLALIGELLQGQDFRAVFGCCSFEDQVHRCLGPWLLHIAFCD